MAYIYPVKIGDAKDGDESPSISTSPCWVLTFLRFKNRNTLNQTQGGLETRAPLVVENDCVNVSVSTSKSSHTPTMTALLRSGDVNYVTALATGDFVIVNMLDFPDHARDVADRAKTSSSINGINDGFKGLFKIQSVRAVYQNDPQTGTKQLFFQIQGFAFTELNNTIYFIPNLINPTELGPDLYFSKIGLKYNEIIGGKGNDRNVQRLIRDFTSIFLGGDLRRTTSNPKAGNSTPNSAFFIPDSTASLMGVKTTNKNKTKGNSNTTSKTVADLYELLLGVQQYRSGTNVSAQIGLNPVIKSSVDNSNETPIACQGFAYPAPEFFNQVTVWSILQRFVNSPINELYTAFRVSPKTGNVVPTIVFRQIPFSSENYKGTCTRFLSLPRWKIDPSLIIDFNLGRDESARINFVQVFGRLDPGFSGASEAYVQTSLSEQSAGGKNVVADSEDIKRSGLRPYVISSQFDGFVQDKQTSYGPQWAKLLGDAVIGGHLKMNGSITCMGIVDPIVHGDNLELNGVVYHIESVSHSCSISPNGDKSFRTTLSLSHGVTLQDEYPQMKNTAMEDERAEDWKNEKLLGGVSDSEDVNKTPLQDGQIRSSPFSATRFPPIKPKRKK